MKKNLLIVIFFTAFIGCIEKEKKSNDKIDYNERCRLLVLEENNPNQNYLFSKKGNQIDEQEIKYLGTVINNKNDTLKIVNYVSYTGLYDDAKRGSGELYIYNKKNEQIGFYYLGSATAVPNKIENNKFLVFEYNNFCNQTTRISLKDSIPKNIFIQCTKEGGDLYTFKASKKTPN